MFEHKAVADLKIIRFGGFLAWLSWLFVHLLFLVGLRNRMQVFFQWAWASAVADENRTGGFAI
jgi:NADH:ubiquinone reductase (H+-translocating)